MTDAPTENPNDTAAPPAPAEQAPEQAAEQAAEQAPAAEKPAKKAPAKKAAAKKTTAKKTAAKKTTAKKTAASKSAPADASEPAGSAEQGESAEQAGEKPAKKTAAKKTTNKTAAKKTAAKKTASGAAKSGSRSTTSSRTRAAAPQSEQLELTPEDDATGAPASAAVLFQAPSVAPSAAAETDELEETEEAEGTDAATPAPDADAEASESAGSESDDSDDSDDSEDSDDEESDGAEGGASSAARRRRRRGGRRRRKPAGAGQGGEGSDEAEDDEAGDDGDSRDTADAEQGGSSGSSARPRNNANTRARSSASAGKDEGSDSSESGDSSDSSESGDDESGDNSGGGQGSASSRRRRRRRRSGEGGGGDDNVDDPENTVTRVRKPRSPEDEITAVAGSTRLEAKKQRRREGREAGRRRAPIVSEAEFLARRESVERVMAVRQRKDLTQIAVLEDKVLVEHYVARESQTSLIGNVYLGRVQNVLPSMEAAFIDIGKGRNAVLYAGEVNWAALGHKDGAPRKIESYLQSGQTVLVQVSKDPIGHKGARLTSQVSLAGRFLVYVPDGTTSGISRKLPDTERARLKALLKEVVPASAGVIVRTAAEGASEEELTRDVERLKARWADIEAKIAKGNAPQLLYGEPDLTLKVVRDLFTEDFAKLVVQGDDAWESVREYVDQVAPDLTERLEHHPSGDGTPDLFATYRIDEQIAKGVDRKVWLPSGGSLVIDRTEAMTVVDVNTGKFTGSGGNLEETVTKNNLEAAEEIVRQLRLRDIGGIIVVDFIDMVLEANRDLVLRRLVECLGRDRTRHQVAEVTSLGLVQMTRKRIGTGLLEAFTETCSHCQGRGLLVHDLPVEPKRGGGGEQDEPRRGNSRRRKGKGQGDDNADHGSSPASAPKPVPSPKDVAAMAKHPAEDAPEDATEDVVTESSAPAQEAPDATPVEPVVQAPADEEPAVEEPAVEAPVVEKPVVDEPVVEEPVVVAPAVEEPVAEAPAVEEPVATTTVVTRTRRRTSTRPAGPPAASPEPSVAPEPVLEESAPAAPPVAPPAAKPAVVTQTRRRSTSRPSGPPAAAESAEPAEGAVDGGETSEPHVEHVPVKKKGARKR